MIVITEEISGLNGLVTFFLTTEPCLITSEHREVHLAPIDQLDSRVREIQTEACCGPTRVLEQKALMQNYGPISL